MQRRFCYVLSDGSARLVLCAVMFRCVCGERRVIAVYAASHDLRLADESEGCDEP